MDVTRWPDLENDEGIWARIAGAPARALLLDFDGTLAPFHADPAKARLWPGIEPLLADIIEKGRSRVVFVTGRSIDSILPLLSLDPVPEIWGGHGWERRLPDGGIETFPLPAGCREILDLAADAVPDGVLSERKSASVAVHWRALDESDALALGARMREAWEPLTANGMVELHSFDGGMEMRVSGRDKGAAIRQILEEMPPGSFSTYLGDDLTDEDAFRALGPGDLPVLVRGEFRPTAARTWLSPPEELVSFFSTWNRRT